MKILGQREETSFMRDKAQLKFLQEHLPMYADPETADYFEKNFKNLSFLKKSDVNPSIKLNNLLNSYAYECNRSSYFKEKKEEFEKSS